MSTTTDRGNIDSKIAELLRSASSCEAQAQIAYCMREEPGAARVFSNRAWRYFDARQYEKAIENAEAAIAIDPAVVDSYWVLGYSLAYLGQFDDARLMTAAERNGIAKTLMLARTGQMDEARAHVEALHKQMDRPADVAMLYAIVEDADAAFTWIDKAIEERHREILLLGTWELFDPLRSDPRFDAALNRIGFTG